MSRRTYLLLSAFVLFCCAAVSSRSSAQAGVAWEALYGSPNDAYEEVRATARDSAGNTIMAGMTWAGDANDFDVLTVRVDPAGNVLWARTFNGFGSYADAANAVAADADGNVYVAGVTWQGYDNPNGTDYDLLLLKYGPSGDLLWSRTYDGTLHAYDDASAIAVDAVGNVLVAGMSWGTSVVNGQEIGHGDYLTIKYAPDGDVLWAQRYAGRAGTGGVPSDLKVNAQGEVFVTGSANVRHGDFDNQDISTVKYSPDGTLVWQSTFDGASNIFPDDSAGRMAMDAAGNIYIVGGIWPGDGDTRQDILLLKLGPDGAFQWSRTWGGEDDDGPTDLAVDSAGNILVAGTFLRYDETMFWPMADAILLKYDPAGTLLWEKAFNGPLNDEEYRPQIVVEPNDDILMAVSTAGSNGFDIALLQYHPDGSDGWSVLYNGQGNDADYIHSLSRDNEGSLFLTATSWADTSFDMLAVKFQKGVQTDVPAVKSLTFEPAAVVGGSQSTGTVTLTAPAPAGGAFVNLLSGDPDAAFVSATMSVGAGQTTGTFTVWTTGVAADTDVAISARSTGDAVSATLTVQSAALTGLDVEPYVIGGNAGQGVVWLSGPAPDPGADVTLASSDPSVAQVDELVTVLGGDINANASFAIRTVGVREPTTVQITATYHGVSFTSDLTVLPASLQYIGFDPSYAPGGRKIKGYVGLNGMAPEGGVTVRFTSEQPDLVTVPISVVVPAGQSFVTFNASTSAVADYTFPTVTATDGVETVSTTVGLRPPILSSIRLEPEAVEGGSSTTLTAVMDGHAPSGGLAITLTSSNPDVAAAPAVLVIPEGATKGSVSIPTAAVAAGTTVTITAQDTAYVRRTASLAVVPSGSFPDQVSIQTARYFTVGSKQRLTVEATSSSDMAILRVYEAGTGRSIGTLYNVGGGKYRATFGVPFHPARIQVKSSFSGSAEMDVTG